MKSGKIFAAMMMAAVLTTGLSACEPTATQEGTGGYIDDTVVTINDK